VRELVSAELSRIRQEPVGDEELSRTKRMLSGGMVLGLESMRSRMTRLAQNELLFGRDVPIEEALEKVNAVTASNIADLANEFLAEDVLTTTAIGPF
jgi:predicted Zn-dependent peptidase